LWDQGAGGTLTVANSGSLAQLTLAGNHASGDFSMANDGAGGLFVKHV